MIYRIVEKQLCFGDDFSITDEAGNLCYYVDGKAFSLGDQLSFQDANGNELAYISQKLLSWAPKYEIYKGGVLFAEVVKEFSWFNKKFTLDVPGPNDYTIEGSFWVHEFTFSRSSGVAAVVSKDRWSWSDSYGVQIYDGDPVAILATCIIIDQILYDDKNK